LIEEFMLLANRTVATHIGKPGKGQKAKVFVYRIHDVPNPDKLKTFSDFIRRIGYKLKIKRQTKRNIGLHQSICSMKWKEKKNKT
jgi:ribonuclease R